MLKVIRERLMYFVSYCAILTNFGKDFDIGKIGIRDSIFSPSGKTIVRCHVQSCGHIELYRILSLNHYSLV